MNETYDPLEAELRELRPHEPSSILRQRIASRLERPSTSRWLRLAPRTTARLAFASAAIAACLLAAILLPRISAPTINSGPPGDTPQPLLSNAFDDTLPSLWSYRTALARSSESLDALLDQHSALTRGPEPERARVFVFTRSQTELDDLLGEL